MPPIQAIKTSSFKYTVAWIAPLEIEALAALHLLDERHPSSVGRGDDYVFHAGIMGGHSVVIATLPAGQKYKSGSAAVLARQVKRFFPNVSFGLLVGGAAGLPDLSRIPLRDIRLGDVLVALPDGESAGLVAYELDKVTGNDFQPLRLGHTLAKTEPVIRAAIHSMLEAPGGTESFLPYYESIRNNEHGAGGFADPGQDHDILVLAQENGSEKAAERARRPDAKRTRVWYGPIGSGGKLLRNAHNRNELRDKYGFIGLEVEEVGTMNRIPVGVIRGVCDYGDRNVNKRWQPYAAAMAASYARALLDKIPPHTEAQAETRYAAASQSRKVLWDRGESPEADQITPERADECADSDQSSDTSSWWSATNSDASSATSGLPHGITRISIQAVADVVLDEAGLATVLAASASHPGLNSEKVLGEFKRLIRYYYRDLQSSSTATYQKQVALLVKKSRGTIAYNARKILGLVHKETPFLGPKPPMSQEEKSQMTMYLLHLEEPVLPLTHEQNGTHDNASSGDNESEDEENLQEDMHPEISAARTFLKDGTPMRQFQANIRRFILNAAREHDLVQSPRYLPFSLPNLVDDLWCRLRFTLPEPEIPHGKRRLRWICSCGLRLYDDFDKQLDGTALDDLETYLNMNNQIQHDHDQSVSAFNVVSQALKWCIRQAQLIRSRLSGQPIERDILPTSHKATVTTVATSGDALTTSQSVNLLYLLHCNSTSEYGVKLHQDLIHDNLNDQELFRFLRTVYCRARKKTKWLTLRNTTSISLCKFFVDHSCYASVQKHSQGCMQQQSQDCVCLPPRSLVGIEYQCSPTPPDPMPLPPFEKNYLMHYFRNPDHLSTNQIWVYKQLPKRMNNPLRSDVDSFLPGWGIYFEDGWNFKTIYLLFFVATVISSLIFGICWSIFKLDVQGAFGITSYWIATVVMGLGYLSLKSIDKL